MKPAFNALAKYYASIGITLTSAQLKNGGQCVLEYDQPTTVMQNHFVSVFGNLMDDKKIEWKVIHQDLFNMRISTIDMDLRAEIIDMPNTIILFNSIAALYKLYRIDPRENLK